MPTNRNFHTAIATLGNLSTAPLWQEEFYRKAYQLHGDLVDALGACNITYTQYRRYISSIDHYERIVDSRIRFYGHSRITMPHMLAESGLSRRSREMYLDDAETYLRRRKGAGSDSNVLNTLIGIANSSDASVEEQLRCVEIMKALREEPPLTWMNRAPQRFGDDWI